MRRRRPEEERDPSPAKKRAGQGITPAGGILALQQTAGNHAVSSMLARKEETATAEPATVDVEGVGVIVLKTWSHRVTQGSASPGGGARKAEGDGKPVEIQLVSVQGAHSRKLQQIAVDTPAIDYCNIEDKGHTVKLKTCFLTSYQLEGSSGSGDEPAESWTIEGTKLP